MKGHILKIVLVLLAFLAAVFLPFQEREAPAVVRWETQPSYTEAVEEAYILNTRSKKIHKTTCGTAALIHEENRRGYEGNPEPLFEEGYSYCGNCYK